MKYIGVVHSDEKSDGNVRVRQFVTPLGEIVDNVEQAGKAETIEQVEEWLKWAIQRECADKGFPHNDYSVWNTGYRKVADVSKFDVVWDLLEEDTLKLVE